MERTPLHHVPVVGDRLSQRVIEEAASVDEGHRHEAAEARYALEVHTGLAHHLLHIDVLEALHDANVSCHFHTLLIDRGHSLAEASVALMEDIMSHANVWLQHGTLNEVVRGASLARMDELDNLWQSGVFMCFIISIDSDSTLRVLKATNIDAGRTSIPMQVLDELW